MGAPPGEKLEEGWYEFWNGGQFSREGRRAERPSSCSPSPRGAGPRVRSPGFPSEDASTGFKNTKEPSCLISVYPQLQELFLSLP